MNLNINSAASIAGTSRAAAKGGEHDAQASETANRQITRDSPAGKPNDSSAIDAGEQTGDRGGNGKQMLDVFQHGEDQEQQESPPDETRCENESQHDANKIDETDGDSGNHLDLQA